MYRENAAVIEPYEDVSAGFKYKTISINNRRYLGNKYKLLNFIKSVVQNECRGVESVADIFSGTGAVASAFKDKKIITNDILYSNYICNLAWFGPEKISREKIIYYICIYNACRPTADNYMSLNFANTYFCEQDCRKIGYIREDIEQNYKAGRINFRERAVLITSLLYAMDKVANTCGHYDAYIRNTLFTKHIELAVPDVANDNNADNMCCNTDSNLLVKDIYADLVYIDPPYNSRQYCDAYHLLENVATWKKPPVKGVALKMDRDDIKSEYCRQTATEAFADLIKNTNAKYILLSYNNMAQKGNDRSNAKITDEDIISILSGRGDTKIFSQRYKPFTAGKSEISNNEERLFLCSCHDRTSANSTIPV